MSSWKVVLDRYYMIIWNFKFLFYCFLLQLVNLGVPTMPVAYWLGIWSYMELQGQTMWGYFAGKRRYWGKINWRYHPFKSRMEWAYHVAAHHFSFSFFGFQVPHHYGEIFSGTYTWIPISLVFIQNFIPLTPQLIMPVVYFFFLFLCTCRLDHYHPRWSHLPYQSWVGSTFPLNLKKNV